MLSRPHRVRRQFVLQATLSKTKRTRKIRSVDSAAPANFILQSHNGAKR